MKVAEAGHRRTAQGGRHADHHPEPEPVPGRQRKDDLRRRLRDGRPGSLFRRRLHHRPDGQGRPHQPRLRRRSLDHERDGQGHDGHRRGDRRQARRPRRGGGDRQPSPRRDLDEGRARPADFDHRRQRFDALRGGRSREPNSPGGRRGSQHHPRRDFRAGARRRGARLGGRDRHRSGDDLPDRARQRSAARRRGRRGSAPPAPGPIRAAAAPVETLQPALVANDVEIQPVAAAAARLSRTDRGSARSRKTRRSTSSRPRRSSRPCAQPRMPQIEDLPQVAQNQLRAMREAQKAPAPGPETRRRSLLEKLAAFGITRHEDEPARRRPPAPAASPPAAAAPAPAPAAQADVGRASPRPSRPAAPRAPSTRTAGRSLALR